VDVKDLVLPGGHERKRLENAESLLKLYFAAFFLILLLPIVIQELYGDRLSVEKAHKREKFTCENVLLLDLLE